MPILTDGSVLPGGGECRARCQMKSQSIRVRRTASPRVLGTYRYSVRRPGIELYTPGVFITMSGKLIEPPLFRFIRQQVMYLRDYGQVTVHYAQLNEIVVILIH